MKKFSQSDIVFLENFYKIDCLFKFEIIDRLIVYPVSFSDDTFL